MATLEIPKDVLDPIINAHVTKALTEVFGNGGLVLQQVVAKVLQARVDDRGEPDRYSSRNAIPYIEYLAREALKEAAKAAVKEALASHQDAMRAAIVKELSKANSPMLKSLAASLVAGVATAAAGSYQLTVTLKEP